VAGSKVLGQQAFMRNRNAEKELAASPFSGMMPRDLWKNKLLDSTSIRGKKSIEASLEFLTPKRSSIIYNLPLLSPHNNSIQSTIIDERSSLSPNKKML
jgi:hypothetical protein